MARIPLYDPQVSTILDKNPPGAPIANDRGAVYQAVGKVAQGIGDWATFAAHLEATRAQAADQNDAQNRVMQDTLDLNQHMEKLKTQSPDDGEGYTASVQSWVEDRKQQQLDQAPTERAKNLYLAKSGSVFTHALLGAQDWENKQRTQSYVTDITDSTQDAGNALVNNPDQKLAYDLHHQLLERINENEGVVFSSDQASQLRAQTQEKIANSYFAGLYAKGIGDTRSGNVFLQQGIASLHGKTRLDQGAGELALFQGLSPEKHAAWLDQFERAVKTNQEIGRSELSAQLRDFEAAARVGQQGNPQTLTSLTKMVAQGVIRPEEAARTMDTVAASQAMGDIVRQMKSLPESHWDPLLNSYQSRMEQSRKTLGTTFPGVGSVQAQDFNLAERERIRKQIDLSADKIKTDRANYPVEATIQAFPSVANQVQAAGTDPARMKGAITSLFAAQATLGVPRKILSSDQEDLLVKGLKSGSPQQQSNQIDGLQKLYGDQFGRVVEELSGKGKVDPHLWAAAYMPDQATRTLILENMAAKKDIEDAFKGDAATTKALSTAVRTQMAPFTTAWSGPGSDPGALDRSNAMASAVTLQAKKLLATHGTTSPTEAVDQAMGIVTKNFTPLQVANSNVLMPNLGNRPEIVRGFMEGALSPEGLKELHLSLPSGIDPGQAYSQIQKYGRWTNPAGNVLELQLAKPGAKPVSLLDQQGKPVRFDMTDISKGQVPDALYQRAVDQANKGTLRKLWERVR